MDNHLAVVGPAICEALHTLEEHNIHCTVSFTQTNLYFLSKDPSQRHIYLGYPCPLNKGLSAIGETVRAIIAGNKPYFTSVINMFHGVMLYVPQIRKWGRRVDVTITFTGDGDPDGVEIGILESSGAMRTANVYLNYTEQEFRSKMDEIIHYLNTGKYLGDLDKCLQNLQPTPQ